jgi:hypothetical protein
MRLLLALLLSASLHATPPSVVGNVNYKYSANPSSNIYISRTAQATDNPCMCAGIWGEASASEIVTDVTFAGTSFTLVTRTPAILAGPSTQYGASLWCATGITAGTLGNVSATVSAADGLVGAVFELNGVKQSGFVGNTGIRPLSNAASPNAITITTSATDSIAISFLGTNYAVGGFTIDGLYTLIYNNSDDASRNNIWISYKTYAASGSTVGSTLTYAGTRFNSQVLGELLAAVSAVAASQPLSPYHSNDLSPRMAPITRP